MADRDSGPARYMNPAAVAATLVVLAVGGVAVGGTGLSDGPPESRFDCDFTRWVDPPGYKTLRPNVSCWFDGARYRIPPTRIVISGDGLRDEQYNRTPPADVTRILVLGDSHTFGWGVNRSDAYPQLLEERLQGRRDRDIQVLNAGVPGTGGHDFVHRLNRTGIAYHPDIVVVTFRSNDEFDSRVERRIHRRANRSVPADLPPGEREERVHSREQELQREYMENLSDRIRSGNSSLLHNLDRIIDRSRAAGAAVVLYHSTPAGDRMKGFYRGWAAERGVTVVFGDERLQEIPHERLHITEHDPHYTPLGNRILAERLHDALVEHDVSGLGRSG